MSTRCRSAQAPWHAHVAHNVPICADQRLANAYVRLRQIEPTVRGYGGDAGSLRVMSRLTSRPTRRVCTPSRKPLVICRIDRIIYYVSAGRVAASFGLAFQSITHNFPASDHYNGGSLVVWPDSVECSRANNVLSWLSSAASARVSDSGWSVAAGVSPCSTAEIRSVRATLR